MSKLIKVIIGLILVMCALGCEQNLSDRQKVALSNSASRAGSGYQLNLQQVSSGCPFISSGVAEFRFDGLLNQVRSQIEAKIEGQNVCQAQYESLLEPLSFLSNRLNSLTQNISEQSELELYRTYGLELQAQLSEAEALFGRTSFEAGNIRTQLMNLQMLRFQLATRSSAQESALQRDLHVQMASRVNSVLASLNKMGSECLVSIGGWSQVLPPLLGAAAVANSNSILSAGVMWSAALDISAQFVQLLKNREAKRALGSLVRLQNEKVLACTYYNIQKSSCEFDRAQNLIKTNRDELAKVVRKSWTLNKDQSLWSEYLYLSSYVSRFEEIFRVIASQGSSLSLDTNLVGKYFLALKIDMKSLDPVPPRTETDLSLISRWLNRATQAGLSFSTFDQFGQSLSVADQFLRALDALERARLDIETVEQTLNETKSFDGLKHSLQSDQPDLLKVVSRLINFYKSVESIVPEKDRGAFYMTLETFNSLKSFLEVDIKDVGDVEDYLTRLGAAGSNLFASISKGSVAQIPLQQVLALGGKAQDRLVQSLEAVRRAFVLSDQTGNRSFEDSFLAFQQRYEFLYSLVDAFDTVSGPGSVFKRTELNTAIESYESAFSDEIESLVKESVTRQSPSAAHLCSLFSGFLSSSRKYQKTLNLCKNQHKSLQITTILSQKEVQIDYNNRCDYETYIRTFRSYQFLERINLSL